MPIYILKQKKDNGKIYTEGNDPKCFSLKEWQGRNNSDYTEIKIINNNLDSRYNERDLHPLLCVYLNGSQTFNAYTRTIFHEKK